MILPFGKYKHQSLQEVAAKDLSYVQWLSRDSFNHEVKAAALALLDTLKAEKKAEKKGGPAEKSVGQWLREMREENEREAVLKSFNALRVGGVIDPKHTFGGLWRITELLLAEDGLSFEVAFEVMEFDPKEWAWVVLERRSDVYNTLATVGALPEEVGSVKVTDRHLNTYIVTKKGEYSGVFYSNHYDFEYINMGGEEYRLSEATHLLGYTAEVCGSIGEERITDFAARRARIYKINTLLNL